MNSARLASMGSATTSSYEGDELLLKALREAEEGFREVFDRAPIGMALVAPDGTFMRVNRSVCELVGYNSSELLQMSFQEITHPDDLSKDLDHLERTLSGEIDTYQMEKRYFHADGSIIWVLLNVSLVRDEDGSPRYFIAQIEDITRRRHDEEQLRSQAELLELAHDAIIVRDMQSRISYWNRGAQETYGYESDEAIGRITQDLLATEFPTSCGAVELALLRDGRWEGEVVHTRKDGSRLIVATRQVVQRDSRGEPKAILEINSDITERKRAEDSLRRLALVDELTGLSNRRAFLDIGTHELSIARRRDAALAVLFIDLNSMKQINDTFGHQEGDRALVATAGLLRRTFRDSDLIARIGGDEFCVLQADVTPEGVDRSKQRLMESVTAHNTAGDAPYSLSLSAGVALLEPGEQVSLQELVDRADEDMYANKPGSRSKAAVLVVEDDRDLRALLGIVLSDVFSVTTVGTGEEALEALASRAFDCVVTDKNLPGLSGTELASRLRSDPARRHIPVMMLTGDERDGELEGLLAGVDDYVLKPFDSDVLKLRLQNLTRSARR
ncbi:MAG: PAS domain S-box protein [Actinomycetota bacterium]